MKKVCMLLVSIAFLLALGGFSGPAAQETQQKGSEPAQEQPADSATVPGRESLSEEIRPHQAEIKEEVLEEKPLEIHGGMVGFYQGGTAGKIEGTHQEDPSGFGFVADLMVTYKPPCPLFKNGRFFVRLHAGKGLGADEDLGDQMFANLNTIADNSDALQTDFDSAFWLAEAYYAQDFADGKVTIVFGKTEPVVFIDNNAFANNPYSQFIGKPFVNNPVMNSEDQLAPIAAVTVTPVECWSLTALGVSTSYPNASLPGDQKSIYTRIFDQPFVAVQLAYAPKFGNLEGNYRVYYWNATYHHENSGGYTSPDGWGVGLSFDQMITEQLGLFARAAYSSEDAFDSDWFWSFGANLKGIIPCRTKDELGVGVAGLKGTVGPDNSDTEFHAEVYYRIVLTENFALSPDLQYVVNPLGNTDNEGVFAGMLRLEYAF